MQIMLYKNTFQNIPHIMCVASAVCKFGSLWRKVSLIILCLDF